MKTVTDTEFYKLSLKERRSFTGIINWEDGSIQYFKNGFSHRLDGPAHERLDGYKEWYIEGKWHNLNGPARIWPNGKEEYWINGIRYFKEDWKQKVLLYIKNSRDFQNVLKYKSI